MSSSPAGADEPNTPLIGGPFDGLEVQREDSEIHLVVDRVHGRAALYERDGQRYVYREVVPMHRLDPRGEVKES